MHLVGKLLNSIHDAQTHVYKIHHQAFIKNIKKYTKCYNSCLLQYLVSFLLFSIKAWWWLNQLNHVACFILSCMLCMTGWQNISRWKHHRDVSPQNIFQSACTVNLLVSRRKDVGCHSIFENNYNTASVLNSTVMDTVMYMITNLRYKGS